MWKDPIVEEVRKLREAHAKKFDYDLQAIYEDLKKREKTSGRQFTSLTPKRVEHVDST